MGVLGNIISAIFGPKAAASQSQTPAAAGGGQPPGAAHSTGAPSSNSEARLSIPSTGPVDVAAILDKAVATKKEKLEWRTSIVDLMKALDLDSSLSCRKELAKDLGYTGDSGDSASMNIWLHEQVMAKLAANGGKVPAALKH